MTQKAFAIAIDGPVAAGKGTIANLLAQKLHGFHLNTGAMYRALALYCLENNIDINNANAVITALSKIIFTLTDAAIFMNKQNITNDIMRRDVTEVVPIIAAIPQVRSEMVKRQREIGMEKIREGKIVIVDARDGATKIFPDALLKIFLTASPEVRAKRRFEQIEKGLSYEQIVEDTKKRDFHDTHRQADPLVLNPASQGYLVVDNSHLSTHDTINFILEKIKEKNDTN